VPKLAMFDSGAGSRSKVGQAPRDSAGPLAGHPHVTQDRGQGTQSPILAWLRRGLAVVFLLALAGSCASAEPVLLVHDASGALLRQAPAVLRPEGHVLVARTALYGAASALLFDDNHATHRVLSVTAEDRDSGVVELSVGLQAPAGAPLASQPVVLGRAAGHDTKAGEYRDVGGFGSVARLTCTSSGGAVTELDAPLYNQHGFLGGWHAVRIVDGRPLAFAIPWARVQEGLQPLARPLDVAAWDKARNAADDEI